MKPTIIIIAGPSGAGKSHLANLLKVDNGYQEIVSTTTRQIRQGEIDGVHYNFLTKEEFIQLDINNGLIEKAEVNGNFYGVSRAEPIRLAKSGKPMVLVAEPEGVSNMKAYCKENNWNCLAVFVSSPVNVLIERLRDRMNSEIEKIPQGVVGYHDKVNRIKEQSHNRAEHVINFEFKNWVEPAYEKNSIYDVVIDEFNQSNQSYSLSIVNEKVNDLMKPKQSIKRKNKP